jgi:hypothetical protein
LPTLPLYGSETVVYAQTVDSAFYKHESRMAMEQVRGGFDRSPQGPWLARQGIPIAVTSYSNVDVYTHTVLLTAQLTPEQRTFFLLRYGPVRHA